VEGDAGQEECVDGAVSDGIDSTISGSLERWPGDWDDGVQGERATQKRGCTHS